LTEQDCALWAIQDVTVRRRTEAELAAAIEAVMRDTSWFSRTILEKLAKLRRPDDVILPHSPSEQAARHMARVAAMRSSADLAEGRAAFREKRKPRFEGR
jgi:enoyl-CoA hydratase/carnithine racemase